MTLLYKQIIIYLSFILIAIQMYLINLEYYSFYACIIFIFDIIFDFYANTINIFGYIYIVLFYYLI